MIQGLDSASEPSAAQAQAAKAGGVGIWSGYIGTRPNTGVRSWSQQGFENARLCGSMPLAYCSGYDDPVGVRNLAIAWRVRLCLDCENGIRGLHDPNSGWVQPFLDASGAGLYGGAQIHQQGFRAPFYVLGAYPTSGDPWNASWIGPSPVPSAPHGWQWAGSHGAFGVTVDSTTFDDWFGTGGDNVSVEEVRAALNEAVPFGYQSWSQATIDAYNNLRGLVPGVATAVQAVLRQLGVEEAEIQQILTRPAVDAGALAAALATALAPNLHATVDVGELSAGVAAAVIPHLPTIDPAALATNLERALAAKLSA
jgi:hypothetical protein